MYKSARLEDSGPRVNFLLRFTLNREHNNAELDAEAFVIGRPVISRSYREQDVQVFVDDTVIESNGLYMTLAGLVDGEIKIRRVVTVVAENRVVAEDVVSMTVESTGMVALDSRQFVSISDNNNEDVVMEILLGRNKRYLFLSSRT